MTSKGGAEGFLFTAVRVIPAEGKVAARGKFARKRAAEVGTPREGGEGVVKRERLDDGEVKTEVENPANGNENGVIAEGDISMTEV